MRYLVATILAAAVAYFAVASVFGDKDQMARKLRRRDDIETILNDATN